MPIIVAAIAIAAAVWSLYQLGIKWSRLFDGPSAAWRLFKVAVDEATMDNLTRSLREMWNSIAMAWLGTLLAGCIAVPLSFLAAENLVPRWWSLIIRQLFNALRSIPEVVLAVAMIPAFGLTRTTGVVVIAIGSIGTLSKLSSEIVESVDRGPIEAAEATGASALQRLRWGVLPQMLPEVASLILYRFEINIRVSAVLGIIGAGGIGAVLGDAFRFKEWGLGGVALVVTIGITIVVDTISGYVRRRILAGPGRAAAVEPVELAADAFV